MGTVYRVFDNTHPNWPPTDENVNSDPTWYFVAHDDDEGDWPGAPTQAGTWHVASAGVPSKQDCIDYLDPPAQRDERHRQVAVRGDARRIAILAAVTTGDNEDIAALADSISDTDTKELLVQILLLISLDYRT